MNLLLLLDIAIIHFSINEKLSRLCISLLLNENLLLWNGKLQMTSVWLQNSDMELRSSTFLGDLFLVHYWPNLKWTWYSFWTIRYYLHYIQELRNDTEEQVDEVEEVEGEEDESLSPELLIKHPLQNKWALWFFKNDRTKEWTANLKLVTAFDTVEDFWG